MRTAQKRTPNWNSAPAAAQCDDCPAGVSLSSDATPNTKREAVDMLDGARGASSPRSETTAGIRCATVTVDEIAQYLGVARTSAYAAIRRGDIPATRIGRRWIVTLAALRDVLRLREEEPWT